MWHFGLRTRDFLCMSLRQAEPFYGYFSFEEVRVFVKCSGRDKSS